MLSARNFSADVWNANQRSYFIDTMLQEMPSPPIYFRSKFDVEEGTIVHEVIDGQQRLSAVLDFYEGKYAISRNLDAEYKGKRYDNLTKEQQMKILKYKFNCAAFEDISDTEVFEIFRRMNTYASPLTKQELRHGNFFGPFSQMAEKMAEQHLPFWESNKIVSYRQMTRMFEVQLTAELLISQMDGIQDKKKSIQKFYENYDQNLPGRAKLEKQFRATIDTISGAMTGTLVQTQFRRPTFFYTLFGVTHHRLFGMPNTKIKRIAKPMSEKERDSLSDSVVSLSNVITLAKEDQRVDLDRDPGEPPRESRVPHRFRNFANACLSQTDNINPREVRMATLYKEAFG